MTTPVIALPYSHAPWPPHLSGYDNSLVPSEHEFSKRVCDNVAVSLNRLHGEAFARAYAMPEQYRCDQQPCADKHCGNYIRGLRDITRIAAEGLFAVQFHIDYTGGQENRGPLVLTNGGYFAEVWATEFLFMLERHSHITRRSKMYDSIFDITNSHVRQIFGGKWFLDCGAINSTIVEVGSINNAKDQTWMQASGVEDVSAAAIYATQQIASKLLSRHRRISC